LSDSTRRKRKAHQHLGQRHLRYIKKERKTLYTELLTGGRLNAYLADINEQVKRSFIVTILSLRGIIMSLRKARDRI